MEDPTDANSEAAGRRLARQAATSVVASVAARVAGAAGGVLTARLLGPAGKGRYGILFVIGLMAGAVATAGIELWASREVAQRGFTARVAGVLRRHTVWATAVTFVVTGAAAAVLIPAGNVTGAEVGVTAFLALSTLVFVFHLAVLLGLGRMVPYARVSVVSAAFYLAWVTVLLVIQDRRVWLVLLGAGLAKALVLLIDRVSPQAAHRTREERTSDYRAALRFGVPASVGDVLEFATYRLDLLVVAAFMSASSVGLYSTAVALTEVLWLIPNAVSQVLLPHVAGNLLRRDTPRLIRVTFAATVGCGVLLVLFRRPITSVLFGSAFAGASVAVAPLVVAAAVLGVWKLIVADLAARGQTRVQAISAVCGLVTMLALDVVLIPRFGITGAGLGSAGGYLVATGVAALAWQRTEGGTFTELVGLRRSDLVSIRDVLRPPAP